MSARNYLRLRLPTQDLPEEHFDNLEAARLSQQSSGPNVTTPPSSLALNINLEIFSLSGNLTLVDPNVMNLSQTYITTEEDEAPILSLGELHDNPRLHGATRRTLLRYPDGREKFISAQVMTSYQERIRSIGKLLIPVAAETLDGDACVICRDPYAATTTPSNVIHEASKMPKCGHIFGRDCITCWLKDNDTCPMCRDEVVLPVGYKLQVWVD
ncbi:hypothetical protein SBOR_5638 [Sclerotinia borealis F-4128]|uniref:RING-type domain-containing protein n=1 Tax=Sclerotinia borealis (strain F-4128) TaxID=1432307 RepID=W9CDQ1_SCLBF|nr:hypothetical protein SBOR_5638 [Sclerotinia borealis F-4128]